MAIGARALRAGKAVIECALLVKPVEAQLRALQSKVSAVGRRFANIGSFGVFGGGAGGGFAGLRNLLVGTIATDALLYPIKLASNIELASAQLSTFTGNAGVARDMLIQLQRFSSVAFIPAEQLSAGAAMLIRYNVAQNRVVGDTKALAVIAAGNTEEFDKLALAYGQVASAGRLQGEEMRQFKNTAFNPLREIAERTGESLLTVRKRMEAGQVSFEEVANALQAAVGPGGRFDGMLGRISNTLRGQFNKAIANTKLILLDVGETALGFATRWFRAINGALGPLGEFIHQNASVYATTLGVAAAVAAAAVAFVTLGLSLQVLSIAAGGFATVLGIIEGLFGLILSPAGIVLGIVGGLAAYFLMATDAGQQFARILGERFTELLDVARATFGGIADALSFGDIQLAGQILWTGLKVAWLTGTQDLREIWVNFKNEFLQMILNLGAEIEKAWLNISASVEKGATGAALRFAAFIEKIGKTDEEKRAIDYLTTSLINLNATNIDRETKAKIDDIKAIQAALDKVFDAKTAAELKDAQEELKKAQDALSALRDAAELGALFGAAAPGIGLDKLAPLALGILDQTAKKTHQKPEGLFDPRLAKEIFGGNQDEELEQLRKIERNTRRQGGGVGIPVV